MKMDVTVDCWLLPLIRVFTTHLSIIHVPTVVPMADIIHNSNRRELPPHSLFLRAIKGDAEIIDILVNKSNSCCCCYIVDYIYPPYSVSFIRFQLYRRAQCSMLIESGRLLVTKEEEDLWAYTGVLRLTL